MMGAKSIAASSTVLVDRSHLVTIGHKTKVAVFQAFVYLQIYVQVDGVEMPNVVRSIYVCIWVSGESNVL